MMQAIKKDAIAIMIEAGRPDLANVIAQERDYAKEYREYHSKPEQKKNRAKRNAARRKMGLKKGDGLEVDHKKPLSKGGSNGDGNLRAVKRSTNRKKGASEAKIPPRENPRAPKLTGYEMGTGLYTMSLKYDRFIHFCPTEAAIGIIREGKLLLDPPFEHFGPYEVFAVSAVWGKFLPTVQLTHIKGDKAAILFQTKTMPRGGTADEVYWERDVELKNAKILKVSQAISMLKKTPHAIPGWKWVVDYKP